MRVFVWFYSVTIIISLTNARLQRLSFIHTQLVTGYDKQPLYNHSLAAKMASGTKVETAIEYQLRL